LEGTFIVTEAIAWFVVIAVLATSVERSFLSEIEQRIRISITTREVADATHAAVVADQVAAATAASAGPSVFLVLLAAFGGFALMRMVQRVDFGPALGSVILLAGTLVGVNVLIHLYFGSLLFWDTSGIVGFIDNPDQYMASGVNLERFIASPELNRPHGSAIAVTFVGLMLTWFRFMVVARSSIALDRMARSFTASFLVVLFTVFIASAAGFATPGRWAVPQFVVGMLGLAIGNHERAVPSREASERTSPWMTSVGGTLGLLVISAVILGGLAYLNVGAALALVGGVLLKVVEIVLIVLITPIYWVLDRIFTWFFDGRDITEVIPDLPTFAFDEVPDGEEVDETTVVIPPFIVNSLKFFAVMGTVWVMYLVGRMLVVRRSRTPEEIEEVRSTASSGAGIGRLLADLFRFKREPDHDAWMDRHGAYQLWGRLRKDAEERGLRPREAETPREFGRATQHYLRATPGPELAAMFERARYGRHFPDDAAMWEAARALEAWEREVPATEELRQSVAGARPLDEADELDLKITMARRSTSSRTDEDALLGQ